MKKNTYNLFLLIFFILKIFSANSQTKIDNQEYYNFFDKIIGFENTGIYNGIIFKENFRIKNDNHEFYLTSQFVTGNITYNKQPFYDVEIKYDIYSDKLIVKIPSQSAYLNLQLINDKIDKFSINNHQFIQIKKKREEFENKTISGFYEISYKSEHLVLFTKHKKSKKDKIEGNIVFSNFKDKSEYFIYLNEKYYHINSKSDLKKIFPNLKKNINKLYSSNRRLFKSDQNTFMIHLIKDISNLLSNQ